VTLKGYTSVSKAEQHAIQFDDEGRVVGGYRGKGWDGVAEVPGRIVRWLGEAVRILGSYP